MLSRNHLYHVQFPLDMADNSMFEQNRGGGGHSLLLQALIFFAVIAIETL